MIDKGIVFALAMAAAWPADAGEIEKMATNLKTSCANHFKKRPNQTSNDSRKFCACFAAEFANTVSLRELDAANGVLTPEIQEQFDRAADACSRDIDPAVAEAGRAWIAEPN